MTLLQQYVKRATDKIAQEQGEDFDADECAAWIADFVHVPYDIAAPLEQLAAYIMAGDINHVTEGGCPGVQETCYAPTWGCVDDGCVACLIQRDWLTQVLP